MDLISTPLDVFISFFVFFVGLVISGLLSRVFCVKVKRAVLLYLWHAFFSFVYALYVINYGGDAVMYYRESLVDDNDLYFGTAGVIWLTSFFTVFLGASFLGASLGYHVFGFIGLLAFYGAMCQVTFDKSKFIRLLATLIVFLPSLSYWSSGIGKDALSFMATGLALWSALKLRRRFLVMAFSVLVMLFVRPHMAGMMVIGLSLSVLFKPGISTLRRVGVGFVFFVAAAVIVPFGLKYAGVGAGASAGEIADYIEKRQMQNLDVGSSINIADLSLPEQLFTYMFRPLPIEARNFFSVAASFDNAILLFLFVVGGWNLIKVRTVRFREHNRVFLWAYSLLAWVILAMTTANLGIAVRQKWMFAPMLIFLLISVMGRPRRTPAE